MNSQSLQDARQIGLRYALGSIVLAAAGLAIDTVASKFKTVNAVPFSIDGVFKSKAAATAIGFSAGHATVPAGFTCLFVIGVDKDGAVSTYQGDLYKAEVDQLTGVTKYRAYALTTNAAGTVIPTKTSKLVDTTSELLIGSPPIPPAGSGAAAQGIPESVAILGAVKVVAGGSDFVPGTTALTGISTFYDFAGVLPSATAL